MRPVCASPGCPLHTCFMLPQPLGVWADGRTYSSQDGWVGSGGREVWGCWEGDVGGGQGLAHRASGSRRRCQVGGLNPT